MSAPVVLFVYNRLKHTRATVAALQANELARESDLHVFCDGAKKPEHAEQVRAVREFVRGIDGFKSVRIIEREANLGLSKSIIGAVTEILAAHGRAIVLEDDIVTAPGFLTFMNAALEAYERRPDVFAVSGWTPAGVVPPAYSQDVYLSHRALCWGWATWADRWTRVDWDVTDHAEFRRDKRARELFARGGEDLPDMLAQSLEGRIDSWAIRWDYAQFKQGSYAVVSATPLADNVGIDGSGTHGTEGADRYQVELNRAKRVFTLPRDVAPDEEVLRSFRKFYSYNWRGKLRKLLGLL